MFSRNKDTQPSAASESSAPIATPTPNNDRNDRKKNVRSAPSIFSADCMITGTIASSGDLQIDGRVEGDITSGSLTIGEQAEIVGEIRAELVTVHGKVDGSIRAKKVHLASTSHVKGDILHAALAVETGAFFEGNCRHADNPLADDAAPKRELPSPAPSPAPEPAPTAAASSAAPSSAEPAKPSAGDDTKSTVTPLSGTTKSASATVKPAAPLGGLSADRG